MAEVGLPSHRIHSPAEDRVQMASLRNVKPVQEQTAIRTRSETAKIKVLIADDEQVIANTLAIILERWGFEARAVYSGEAAVQVLGSFEPDVLISDVVMTGMTGVETAIAVRTQQPNCKILLFSGQAATADLLQEARMQGHGFEIISKPVHSLNLLAKLRMEC